MIKPDRLVDLDLEAQRAAEMRISLHHSFLLLGAEVESVRL